MPEEPADDAVDNDGDPGVSEVEGGCSCVVAAG